MANPDKSDGCTTLVQVILTPNDVQRLELLQVALGQGFGQLLSMALDQGMPRFRSLVLAARDARRLPRDFDFAALGLNGGYRGNRKHRMKASAMLRSGMTGG